MYTSGATTMRYRPS